MFFTRVGRVVARLALMNGVICAGIAAVPYSRGIAEAFDSSMIELGKEMALFGIVLGVLTEMLRSSRNRPTFS